MIIYVWAQDEKGLIGKEETLPWSLPNDLQFFKQVTIGETIVMGRKTFEGMGKRLLPNRRTIILTRNSEYDANGAEVETDIQVLLEDSQHEDLYIVGGAELYRLFSDYVDVLYRTVIHHEFEGDTYFPEMDYTLFTLKKSVDGTVDDKNHYAHTFELWVRK